MDQITPPELLTRPHARRLRFNLGPAVVIFGLALTVLWLGAMAAGLVLLVWNAV